MIEIPTHPGGFMQLELAFRKEHHLPNARVGMNVFCSDFSMCDLVFDTAPQ